MTRLRQGRLDLDAFLAAMDDDEAGAAVLFVGRVRRSSDATARPVRAIRYEAYPELAERALQRIENDAVQLGRAVTLRIMHRIGEVPLGGATVAIAASSPHREEAFAACRDALERLKHEVPIWKKEVYEDGGTAWLDGRPLAAPAAATTPPAPPPPAPPLAESQPTIRVGGRAA